MKYQIILESSQHFSDDEFSKIVEDMLETYLIYNGFDAVTNDFKVLYAQSLEGVKEEVFAKHEDTVQNFDLGFADISSLFAKNKNP